MRSQQTAAHYGDGLNVRDWIYVEDHCEAIELVLARAQSAKRLTSVADANKQTCRSCKRFVDSCKNSYPIYRIVVAI